MRIKGDTSDHGDHLVMPHRLTSVPATPTRLPQSHPSHWITALCVSTLKKTKLLSLHIYFKIIDTLGILNHPLTINSFKHKLYFLLLICHIFLISFTLIICFFLHYPFIYVSFILIFIYCAHSVLSFLMYHVYVSVAPPLAPSPFTPPPRRP